MKKIYASLYLVVLLVFSNHIFAASENSAGIVKIRGNFGDKKYDIELFSLKEGIKNRVNRDMSHENNQTLFAVKKDEAGQSYVSSVNYSKYKEYLDQDLKPREYDDRVNTTLKYVADYAGQQIYIKDHKLKNSYATTSVPALADDDDDDERANLYDAFCKEVDNYLGEYGFMEHVEKFNDFKQKLERQEQISIVGTVKIEDDNGVILKDIGVFQYTFYEKKTYNNQNQYQNNKHNKYKKYDEKCRQKHNVKECDKNCYHRCFNPLYNSYGFNTTNNANTKNEILAAIYDLLHNNSEYFDYGNMYYGNRYTIEEVLDILSERLRKNNYSI